MAGNIPGTNNSALPGVYTQIETQSSGVSIPGGTRIVAIIGEGYKSETIVASALGNGQDGWNSNYDSTQNSDGRHFMLSQVPIVPNRTVLKRNGTKLVGLEQAIDSNDFDSAYDYRVDTQTGKIELQKARPVDQGGLKYSSLPSNDGEGYIDSITVDSNAPSEVWTIRCVSVEKTSATSRVDETAKFIAFGSVSGNKLLNGNPVFWKSNGIVISNGLISFSIKENKNTASPATSVSPFKEGDTFKIIVKSGVLNKNDSLTASYIPYENVNSPTFFDSMTDIVKQYGEPKGDDGINTLSLGAKLAFDNGAPGVMCVQAKPSTPKRTSYLLSDGLDPNSTNKDDFMFPLPDGVTPTESSNIQFFIKPNTVSGVEKQCLPNKIPFYSIPNTSVTEDAFINDSSTYKYSYTVVEKDKVKHYGFDGNIKNSPSTTGSPSYDAIFSASTLFTSEYDDLTLKLKIIDSTESNSSVYSIKDVLDGKLYVSIDDFKDESGVSFDWTDTSGASPQTYTYTSVDLTNVFSKQAGLTFVLPTSPGTSTPYPTPTVGSTIVVKGSTKGQNGKYRVTTTVTPYQIVIEKFITTESNLRYEILDTASTRKTKFVLINKYVAQSNHSLRVSIVDDRDKDFYDSGWLEALESLEAEDVDIVVPLPTQNISNIFQNAFNHCKVASSIKNKRERVLFCGAISGLQPENLIGTTPKPVAVENIGVLEGIQGDDDLLGTKEDLSDYSVKNSFGSGYQSYRCVYFYPDQILVQAGSDNVFVDGFYLAAAAGGYLSGITNVSMPLTNKVLSGFTILRDKKLTNLKKEQMLDSGITVVEPVQGGGRVVCGVTTTNSGFVEEQEISIVFIRDRIAKALRDGFAGFIGLPEDASLVPTLTARAVAMLNSFISQNLITDYKDLSIMRDSVDPRQWNISVRCQPSYPVNYIFIKVSLGLI